MTNYTSGGNMEQIATLVQLGVLPCLCNLLDGKDWKTVSVSLDGITNILAVRGADFNPILDAFLFQNRKIYLSSINFFS